MSVTAEISLPHNLICIRDHADGDQTPDTRSLSAVPGATRSSRNAYTVTISSTLPLFWGSTCEGDAWTESRATYVSCAMSFAACPQEPHPSAVAVQIHPITGGELPPGFNQAFYKKIVLDSREGIYVDGQLLLGVGIDGKPSLDDADRGGQRTLAQRAASLAAQAATAKAAAGMLRAVTLSWATQPAGAPKAARRVQGLSVVAATFIHKVLMAVVTSRGLERAVNAFEETLRPQGHPWAAYLGGPRAEQAMQQWEVLQLQVQAAAGIISGMDSLTQTRELKMAWEWDETRQTSPVCDRSAEASRAAAGAVLSKCPNPIVGNGGSSMIAGHVRVELVLGFPTICLSSPNKLQATIVMQVQPIPWMSCHDSKTELELLRLGPLYLDISADDENATSPSKLVLGARNGARALPITRIFRLGRDDQGRISSIRTDDTSRVWSFLQRVADNMDDHSTWVPALLELIGIPSTAVQESPRSRLRGVLSRLRSVPPTLRRAVRVSASLVKTGAWVFAPLVPRAPPTASLSISWENDSALRCHRQSENSISEKSRP